MRGIRNWIFPLGLFGGVIWILLQNSSQEPYTKEISYASSLFFFSLGALWLLLNSLQKKCNITIIDASIIGFIIFQIFHLYINKTAYFSSADVCKWGAAIMIYLLVRNAYSKTSILYIIIASGIFETVTALFQQMGYIESVHTYFTIVGHLNNPGPFGGYIAVCLFLSIHLFKESSLKQKNLLYFPIIILLSVGILVSDSRVAWLGFLIGSITFIPYKKLKRKFVVIGAFLLLTGMFLYSYRPDSVEGRLLVGKVTIEMIADKPLFGHGIGSFPHKYMLYQAAYLNKEGTEKEKFIADNIAYAYNEYLHCAAETGIAGCIVLFLAIMILCRYSKNKKIKGALLVWGVFSLFSYPVSVFPLFIMLFVLLGCLQSPLLFSFSHKSFKLTIIGCCLLLSLFAFKQTYVYRKISTLWTQYSENRNTISLDKIISYSTLIKSDLTFHLTFMRKILRESKDVLQSRLLEEVIPTTDTYILLGNYYRRLGYKDKAIDKYLLASQMVPCRLLPPYRLFRLYLENGDSVKAFCMAHHIVSQPIKVNSSFIINAKNEARKFIDGQELKSALRKAGDHRIELECIMQHYGECDNNEKKKRAACYLITNMVDHYSYNDILLDAYADRLSICDWNTTKDKIYKIWDSCYAEYPNPPIKFERDLKTLSAEYLIDNIDHSYKTWKNAPWHHQISFETYCKYILPYRVNKERLSAIGWRDSLYNQYHPLIEKETDVKKAFAVICQHITHHFRNTQPNYPREMDALSINKIRPGNCSLRCLFTVYVLRALGIPACYDFVEHWSNYSTRGHAWVSLVTHPDSTFTLHKGDSIPLYHNRIDGSVFKADLLPEADYPYPLDSIKKAAQIFRFVFDDEDNNHCLEVTPHYGTSRTMIVKDAPVKEGFCDLSIFLTGKDWSIIKSVPVCNSQISIGSIGYDQLYLFTYKDEAGKFVESFPAIFHSNGQLEYLKGNKEEKETVVAYRKYPLFIHQTETWCKMKGCIIEASHSKDFKNAETLLEVHKIPFRFPFHSVSPTQTYRYVRYKSTNRWGTALAEFEVYGKDKIKLKGKPIGYTDDVKMLANGIDGSYHTFVTSYGADYWYGLDLGSNPPHIEQVRFLPKNDANYIEPGHTYEMLYYDNQWISLGTQVARCDSLTYEIPVNSLTLIKDLTAGKEERPFVYKENTIQWW